MAIRGLPVLLVEAFENAIPGVGLCECSRCGPHGAMAGGVAHEFDRGSDETRFIAEIDLFMVVQQGYRSVVYNHPHNTRDGDDGNGSSSGSGSRENGCRPLSTESR